MKHLIILISLFATTSLFAQSPRGGDCKCYEGTVLEPGTVEVIQVTPSKTVTTVIPATYETKTRTITVTPATTSADPACPTCVIEVPAVIVTETYEVEVTPERLVTNTTPAVYKDVATNAIKYDGRYITKSTGECGNGGTTPVRGAQTFEVTGENLQVTPIKGN